DPKPIGMIADAEVRMPPRARGLHQLSDALAAVAPFRVDLEVAAVVGDGDGSREVSAQHRERAGAAQEGGTKRTAVAHGLALLALLDRGLDPRARSLGDHLEGDALARGPDVRNLPQRARLHELVSLRLEPHEGARGATVGDAAVLGGMDHREIEQIAR